ncbi:hypothetical protein CDD83_4660 [Cordyceps sp. RAO-2017]|nr:hypothetical protein CDD83_4660 [Cordyceps sp. RAO-2017]
MLLSPIVFAFLCSVDARVYGEPRISPRQLPSLPPLLDATLGELRAGLDGRLFTSVDLVHAYIARTDEVNSRLRAVTEINPDALLIAAQLDGERARLGGSALRSPLHGIPILVKDLIATRDRMNNTAGSYALLGAQVPEDSGVVAKLRRAGAIILGKTNLSQWAAARSDETVNGWSAYGGQTLGAYYPDQSPSGSSSGSAVAASLGLAWAALGTETTGSIIGPAGRNNLVGIKPTVGLTSRHLVVPLSKHIDTVGPMARTVKDAAYLLSAMAGPDDRDQLTMAPPFSHVPDYAAACRSTSLRGRRIGVVRSLIREGLNRKVGPTAAAFESALDVLREAGAEVIDVPVLPGINPQHIPRSIEQLESILMAGALTDLPTYFSQLTVNPHRITSLAGLVAFTRGHPLEDYPARDTGFWDKAIQAGLTDSSPELGRMLREQMHLAGPLGLTGALQNYSLDAIVGPANTPVTIMSSAFVGTPIVTVPWGRYPEHAPLTKTNYGNLYQIGPNQPFGISFTGSKWSEETLIAIAYAFEQRTMVRKAVKPYIQPQTELEDVLRRKG